MGGHFQYWHEGFAFIGVMLIIVGFPCVAVGILGSRLIDHMGQYPSRSARLQMSVCIQLLLIEIVSFLLLALFFHIFSD